MKGWALCPWCQRVVPLSEIDARFWICSKHIHPAYPKGTPPKAAPNLEAVNRIAKTIIRKGRKIYILPKGVIVTPSKRMSRSGLGIPYHTGRKHRDRLLATVLGKKPPSIGRKTLRKTPRGGRRQSRQ